MKWRRCFSEVNVLSDPLLTSIADKLDAIAGIDADDLRSSADLRTHVAKKASDILADLSDLI